MALSALDARCPGAAKRRLRCQADQAEGGFVRQASGGPGRVVCSWLAAARLPFLRRLVKDLTCLEEMRDYQQRRTLLLFDVRQGTAIERFPNKISVQ